VVIVSEWDPMSAEGVERLKMTALDTSQLQRTWILLNKVLPEFTEALGSFLQIARYLPPIPWDVEIVRAYVRRRTGIDMQRGNAATLSVLKTVGALFPDLEDKITSWRETREGEIKAPVKAQLESLEMVISLTRDELLKVGFAREELVARTRYISLWAATAVAAAIASVISVEIVRGIGTGELTLLLSASVGIGAAVVAIVSLSGLSQRARVREQRFELERRASMLERQLEDTEDQRRKLKVILESDLSSQQRLKPKDGM